MYRYASQYKTNTIYLWYYSHSGVEPPAMQEKKSELGRLQLGRLQQVIFHSCRACASWRFKPFFSLAAFAGCLAATLLEHAGDSW